ncbi:hypothetical protein QQX09_13835 [Demequina sp. SYSU T00192]|uniref:DUF2771 domain-containing protein n=1 Tax=Demequina litoralis TaxID=3051660 RepID=A0ABT8GCS8_9MICO|nr:hypothetical protein [Demequina sp. SYSU T00192]MDN4476935.1 hypothetical protein [Demequina sp. SYSU T00192]
MKPWGSAPRHGSDSDPAGPRAPRPGDGSGVARARRPRVWILLLVAFVAFCIWDGLQSADDAVARQAAASSGLVVGDTYCDHTRVSEIEGGYRVEVRKQYDESVPGPPLTFDLVASSEDVSHASGWEPIEWSEGVAYLRPGNDPALALAMGGRWWTARLVGEEEALVGDELVHAFSVLDDVLEMRVAL